MSPRKLSAFACAVLLGAFSVLPDAFSQPSISIGDTRVIEGDSLSRRARFTVTASGDVCAPVSVDFTTLDGSASSGSDYTFTSGTLTLVPGAPRYSSAWTEGGSGYIQSIVAGRNDDLFAADLLGNRVVHLNRDLTPIKSWGTTGSGPGEFMAPRGIAQDSDGNLYVLDSDNHRVQKFNEAGDYLAEWGTAGSGPGEFDFNTIAIAIDAANNIYVSDRGDGAPRGRIQKFDASGNFITEWLTARPRPFELGVGANGNVFVNAWDENGLTARIETFQPDGTPIEIWDGTRTAGIVRGHARISSDGCGRLWISDLDRLVVMTEDGTFVTELPLPSTAPIELPFLSALLVDDAGNIFVARDGSPSIFAFEYEQVGTIEVPVHGDTAFEANETFAVALSNAQNGTLADGSGDATIMNDDSNVGPNLVANPSFDTSLNGWAPIYGSSLTLVPNGHDDDSAVLVTVSPDSIKSFGINDSPDAIASADSAWARYRFSAWVKHAGGTGPARLRVREYLGTELQNSRISANVELDSTWKYVAVSMLTVFGGSHFDFQVLMDPDSAGAAFLVDDIAIQRIEGDAAPVLDVPQEVTRGWMRNMSLPVSITDPDGDLITSLTADLSDLPGGNNARFTTRFDRATGTVRWEPGLSAIRPEPYRIVVRGGNVYQDVDTILVHVSENVVENSSFENGVAGWNGDQGVVIEEITDGRTDDHALRATNTLGLSNFGINDSPNWVDSPANATTMEFTAWVRSPNAAGPVWLWIREYYNGVLINSVTSLYREPVTTEWMQLRLPYSSMRPIGSRNSTIDFQIMMAASQAGATTGNPMAPEHLDVDDVTVAFFNVPVLDVPQGTPAPAVQQLVSPNPMRATASLALSTTRRGPLHAQIFDLSGRVVRTIADLKDAPAGEHRWSLKARDEKGRTMPAGVYFYRVSSVDGVRRGRFVVLK